MGPSGPIFFCNNIGAIASILRQPLFYLENNIWNEQCISRSDDIEYIGSCDTPHGLNRI